MREYVGYFLIGVLVALFGLHKQPRQPDPKPTVH